MRCGGIKQPTTPLLSLLVTRKNVENPHVDRICLEHNTTIGNHAVLCRHAHFAYAIFTRRSRSELLTTKTDEKAIAAAANTGLNCQPVKG